MFLPNYATTIVYRLHIRPVEREKKLFAKISYTLKVDIYAHRNCVINRKFGEIMQIARQAQRGERKTRIIVRISFVRDS